MYNQFYTDGVQQAVIENSLKIITCTVTEDYIK